MNDSGVMESLAPALVQLTALSVETSISRAAARSGTSQPTLSRAVRRWEADLGFALVEADGRSLRLTEEGRVLSAAAATAVQVMEQALARIRGVAPVPAITVGFLRSLGPTVVGEIVASFLQERPDVLIAHREASSMGIVDGLDSRDIDIAITAPRPPARFEWLPLGRQAFTVLVPASHRLSGSDCLSLTMLVDEPIIALDRGYHARQVADALWASIGRAPRIVLEADSLVTVANYVGAGHGVAIMPADSSSHPRTVSIPISDPGATRAFGLAWSPQNDGQPALSFVNHARTLGERYPGWADIDI